MAAFPGHLCPKCGTKIFCDVTLSNREYPIGYIPARESNDTDNVIEEIQKVKKKKTMSKRELWQRERRK